MLRRAGNRLARFYAGRGQTGHGVDGGRNQFYYARHCWWRYCSFRRFFALSFVRAGIQNEKKRFFRVFLTFSGKARIILLILGKDGAAPKSDERSKQNGKAFAVCGAPHALAARVPSVIQKPWGAFPVLWKGFLFYII
ncbi:MAG TPA: hypothetical protein IAC36_05475 [Candidatus Aphodomonas merdavium]|nr:hypothetical protein [Candidatus Aphodomonas merdavium]